MSISWTRGIKAALLVTVLSVVALAAAPATAHTRHQTRTYGATGLALNPTAASALKSLGITPGLVKPAYARHGRLEFPITTPFARALTTGVIKHSGGLTLSKGKTTVKLTDFWIKIPAGTLSAKIGGARVAILKLDYRHARLRLRHRGLTLGPISARLTAAAAGALDKAFNTTAFKAGLLLGRATVAYRLP